MIEKPYNTVYDGLRLVLELEAEYLLKEGVPIDQVKSALMVGSTALVGAIAHHLGVRVSQPIKGLLQLTAAVEANPTAIKGYELALPRELSVKPTDN